MSADRLGRVVPNLLGHHIALLGFGLRLDGRDLLDNL